MTKCVEEVHRDYGNAKAGDFVGIWRVSKLWIERINTVNFEIPGSMR